MEPTWQQDGVSIYQGSCLDILPTLPAESVQAVITSPPYWSLRDYGIDGQFGLEKTPDCLGWATGQPCGECYVCHTVQWARQVRRVLRGDGVMWLVLGDSYASGSSGDRKMGDSNNPKAGRAAEWRSRAREQTPGFKPKDLVGIPWRVALALQSDGWWLRSDVIWSKLNPMPESVTDRPTKSHEYCFMFSKSARYYWDAEAVKEPAADYERKGGTAPYTANGSATHGIGSNSLHQMAPNGRNLRSVWTIATQPYSGAHFATFPPALVEPMIKAATSEGGCCPLCGKAWERLVEIKKVPVQKKAGRGKGTRASVQTGGIETSVFVSGMINSVTTVGWRPTCDCPPAVAIYESVPSTILDPFGGSGTTAAVAVKLGRRAILCELNPDYVELAKERVSAVQVQMRLPL